MKVKIIVPWDGELNNMIDSILGSSFYAESVDVNPGYLNLNGPAYTAEIEINLVKLDGDTNESTVQ